MFFGILVPLRKTNIFDCERFTFNFHKSENRETQSWYGDCWKNEITKQHRQHKKEVSL